METGLPRSCWRCRLPCPLHDPVTVWFCFQGLENEYQEEGQLLGQFMFDQEGESLQTFPVPVSTCHAHWSQPLAPTSGPGAVSKLPEGVAQPPEGAAPALPDEPLQCLLGSHPCVLLRSQVCAHGGAEPHCAVPVTWRRACSQLGPFSRSLGDRAWAQEC